MAYTVWKDGIEIGRTDLELRLDGRRRGGRFVPNQYGLTVLPGITPMLPALVAFGEMCRRLGMNVEEYSGLGRRFPFGPFAATPEGRAVAEAARHLAGVELRDERGQTVVWEILLISDVDEVHALAPYPATAAPANTSGNTESIYLISVTLAPRLRSAFDNLGLAEESLTIC